MAAFEQKDLSGALFKNKDKSKPSAPDYKGSALIEGKEYWLNAWVNTAKQTGEKYMSLSLQIKDQRVTPEKIKEAGGFVNEDVPFMRLGAGSSWRSL